MKSFTIATAKELTDEQVAELVANAMINRSVDGNDFQADGSDVVEYTSDDSITWLLTIEETDFGYSVTAEC